MGYRGKLGFGGQHKCTTLRHRASEGRIVNAAGEAVTDEQALVRWPAEHVLSLAKTASGEVGYPSLLFLRCGRPDVRKWTMDKMNKLRADVRALWAV